LIDRKVVCLYSPVSFGEASKMSITVYDKFKVDLNIDNSQRHNTSPKKQDFKLDYSSNKALIGQCRNANERSL
jgi:hypothetical protein